MVRLSLGLRLSASALLCASAAATPLLPAPAPQVEAPAFSQVPYVLDTGWVESAASSSTELELTETLTVQQPGAAWMRIYFDEVVLAGDPLAGTGAELRILSLVDGGLQRMNAIEIERWSNSTAYFNGDVVVIELWARPNSGTSRIQVASLDMGLAPASDPTICGNADDRLPSTDPRSGRLLPVGCTGWLINDCAGCALTAGHCTGNIGVLQFNVPPSLSSGAIQNPPPSDQYPVDPASLQTNGGQGVGNDYAYFGTFANGTTGLTVNEAQGPGFVLMDPPAGAATIRITGFGTDNTPATRNQVQQTHTGPLVSVNGTALGYATDTTGGNSGSPVIWEEMGAAIGIHTHGGCTAGGGNNSGTSLTSAGLQAFLSSPEGICSAGVSIQNAPTLVSAGAATQIVVQSNGPIIAGSATLHYRASASDMFQSSVMADLGSGLFGADLPPFDCGDSPQFYVSAQSVDCGQLFDPVGGPNGPGEVAVGTAAVAFGDDFEFNLGWTTAVLGASSGQWQRGVPVDDPNWAFDPSSDGDGSGSAYLTQNANGNTDIDGGAVRLTSPVTMVAEDGTQVSYLRYQELSTEGQDDMLVVEVSANGGASFTQVASFDTSTGGGWSAETISPAQLSAAGVTVGSSLVVRFTANDDGAASIHEAGIDGFSVESISCDPNAVGVTFCGPAVANSTGVPATLRGEGSPVAATNDLTLITEGLPQNSSGYYLVSQTSGNVPGVGGSSGTLCLGLPLGRYAGNVLNSGTSGTYQMSVDLTSIPQPLGSVVGMVGETWRFQAWYRDQILGFPTSNLSDGLAVTLQ